MTLRKSDIMGKFLHELNKNPNYIANHAKAINDFKPIATKLERVLKPVGGNGNAKQMIGDA